MFQNCTTVQELHENTQEHTLLLKSLGPYDFCDVENTNIIAESSHKNRIYCITGNVTEFVKFWMDSLHQKYVSTLKSKRDVD